MGRTAWRSLQKPTTIWFEISVVGIWKWSTLNVWTCSQGVEAGIRSVEAVVPFAIYYTICWTYICWRTIWDPCSRGFRHKFNHVEFTGAEYVFCQWSIIATSVLKICNSKFVVLKVRNAWSRSESFCKRTKRDFGNCRNQDEHRNWVLKIDWFARVYSWSCHYCLWQCGVMAWARIFVSPRLLNWCIIPGLRKPILLNYMFESFW